MNTRIQYNLYNNSIPKVTKDWKVSMNSVLDNIEKVGGGSTSIQFQYEQPRKCLQAACQFEAEDPADMFMFKHIRQQHVKSITQITSLFITLSLHFYV